MTILPAKKKRDKESSQRASASSSNEPSTSKRSRTHEDGPPNKRSSGVMPPATSGASAHTRVSPLSSPRNSNVAQPPDEPAVVDYNSDDEYQLQNVRDDSVEADFANRLAARGLVIKEMVGDGACMFRAIAEQVYGDQEMHGQIRRLCMDYMSNNKDHFREFITENFENYIQRKREENVHGNHVELQAISEMFARPVEVYQYSDEPINVLLPRAEPAEGSSSNTVQQNAPLRLSYHRAVHYNAILAPNVPTIGVGLGLPGMVPGSADKELMSKAMASSELEHLEETMLKDKIDMTDFQRTQADLEDQIARESVLTYLNDLEKSRGGAEQGPSTSAAVEGAEVLDAEGGRAISLYEEMLAAQSLVPEWDAFTDDVAMAEALLVSQQDYMSINKPGPSNAPEDGSGPSH